MANLARNGVVGIAFVDVADFMAITAERGDAVASELLSDLQRIIDREIRVVKGECVKRLGDGYLLAFPSASQAVRGAASIREGVRRHRLSDSRFDLKLRIAVHSGEPLLEQADLIGLDVNLAARLLDHCDPDEIVVSETAREAAERRLRKVTFDNKRLVRIEGLSGKIPIYSASGA
ncbi:MAG: adenylate/guanylate cyclase domain-containing protein [Acidimicrobiia bacterium]